MDDGYVIRQAGNRGRCFNSGIVMDDPSFRQIGNLSAAKLILLPLKGFFAAGNRLLLFSLDFLFAFSGSSS